MIIQEFLPNPIGKDNDGEYIKLFNDGREAVNLSGWKIKDASGKIYLLNGKNIIGQGKLILDYATTKISLNNNGETLFLYDSSGELIDEVGYIGSAAEGMVYGKKVELSGAIKQELFEDLPGPSGNVIQTNFSLDVFLAIIVTGLILASLSIFIIRKLDIKI